MFDRILQDAYQKGELTGRDVGVVNQDVGETDPNEVYSFWQENTTQYSDYANDTLPEFRRLAGCKDSMGVGTYTDCTEEQDFLVQDLVDKYFEGAYEGIQKSMGTRCPPVDKGGFCKDYRDYRR